MKQLLFCLLSTCALPLTVSAHVLDQYLQVTQIALAPDGVRLELRLIPGVQVADRICTLIDADGNGQISTAEEQAYAQRVLQDMELSLKGVPAPLTLSELQFPTQQEMRAGLGTIRLTLTAAVTLSVADQQQLYFRNNHLPELGVYLVNALVPTASEIKISGQTRDPLHMMQLSLRMTSADTARPRSWTGEVMSGLCLVLLFWQWKHLREFLHRRKEQKMYAKKIVS